jgi:hypothetical protein
VKHQTVSGVTPDCPVCQWSNGYLARNGRLQLHSMRYSTRQSEHAQLAHRTVYRICLVHHRTAQRPHLSELQWSEPNDRLTWLAHRTVSDGAPDCPVRHATTTFQRPHFGGCGYKYPNHPTFNCIQVFHLQHITRAIAFNSRHNQRDQILSQVRNHSKSNSD